MKVSAVGFLFQDKVKKRVFSAKNYTCVIHKVNPDGNFNRSIMSAPVIKSTQKDVVTPLIAKADVLESLNAITSTSNKNHKFKGATIKNGVQETEIHALLSDKLFAVRDKDKTGKNHFSLMGKNKTKQLLEKNLFIIA